MSGLEKKINHTCEILTTTVNKTVDEDVFWRVYQRIKKFQDRKTKAWISHNISNILYQAECGGAGSPIFPPFNSGQNFSRSYPQHQYPGPGTVNLALALLPAHIFPRWQTTSIPLELQTKQEEEYNFKKFFLILAVHNNNNLQSIHNTVFTIEYTYFNTFS